MAPVIGPRGGPIGRVIDRAVSVSSGFLHAHWAVSRGLCPGLTAPAYPRGKSGRRSVGQKYSNGVPEPIGGPGLHRCVVGWKNRGGVENETRPRGEIFDCGIRAAC